MGLNAEINVVSLIDVILLLMVIFMITAPIMQGGIDINLPKAEAKPLEPKSGLVVSIDAKGGIHIEDANLSFSEFRATFKTLAADRGKDGVYLRADAGVPYGTVVKVLAVMRASGSADVGLVAEPEAER